MKTLEEMRCAYPEEFVPEDKVFDCIHRGDHLFVGTGCGEPQHLVGPLAEYVDFHPKAFFDTEVFHAWTLGVAPYARERFKPNFRHDSFFIGDNTREAVNACLTARKHRPRSRCGAPTTHRRACGSSSLGVL